jgi:hypothetical protein
MSTNQVIPLGSAQHRAHLISHRVILDPRSFTRRQDRDAGWIVPGRQWETLFGNMGAAYVSDARHQIVAQAFGRDAVKARRNFGAYQQGAPIQQIQLSTEKVLSSFS